MFPWKLKVSYAKTVAILAIIVIIGWLGVMAGCAHEKKAEDTKSKGSSVCPMGALGRAHTTI